MEVHVEAEVRAEALDDRDDPAVELRDGGESVLTLDGAPDVPKDCSSEATRDRREELAVVAEADDQGPREGEHLCGLHRCREDPSGEDALDSTRGCLSRPQISFGMSPGDGSIPEPYFYITPWPLPAGSDLPPLDSAGSWHTEGFTGALLHASELVKLADSEDEQRRAIDRYLRAALSAGRALIAKHP